MVKFFNKLSIEGKYLNIIKAIYGNSTANITVSGEKLKGFTLKSEIIQGCLFSTPLFNLVLNILV